MKLDLLYRRSLPFLLLMVSCFVYSYAHAQSSAKLISFWDDREDSSALKVNHSRWQEILTKYVDDQHPSGINRFDYANVSSADEQSLGEYLEYLQSFEPRQFNNKEQLAYWLNLYNAMCVYLVLSEGGAKLNSIQRIGGGMFRSNGPWREKVFSIVEQKLSLNNIENGILRPIWQDHRIHYALNKASLGGPSLLKTAFTHDNLEELLDVAEKQFINHPRAVSIENGKLTLSEIYNWYALDFATNFQDLMSYLAGYAEPDLAAHLQNMNAAKYQYDWALNKP